LLHYIVISSKVYSSVWQWIPTGSETWWYHTSEHSSHPNHLSVGNCRCWEIFLWNRWGGESNTGDSGAWQSVYWRDAWDWGDTWDWGGTWDWGDTCDWSDVHNWSDWRYYYYGRWTHRLVHLPSSLLTSESWWHFSSHFTLGLSTLLVSWNAPEWCTVFQWSGGCSSCAVGVCIRSCAFKFSSCLGEKFKGLDLDSHSLCTESAVLNFENHQSDPLVYQFWTCIQ